MTQRMLPVRSLTQQLRLPITFEAMHLSASHNRSICKVTGQHDGILQVQSGTLAVAYRD